MVWCWYVRKEKLQTERKMKKIDKREKYLMKETEKIKNNYWKKERKMKKKAKKNFKYLKKQKEKNKKEPWTK